MTKTPLLALALVLITTISTTTMAWPSGSGTCHATVAEVSAMASPVSTTNPGYYVSASALNYTATTTSITISVGGPASIKGILLYGAFVSDNERAGQFENTNFNSDFHYMQSCDPTFKSTVTHMNANLKTLPVSFVWQPPADRGGDVGFHAVVALTTNDWYIVDVVTVRGPPEDNSGSRRAWTIAVAVSVSVSVIAAGLFLVYIYWRWQRRRKMHNDSVRHGIVRMTTSSSDAQA